MEYKIQDELTKSVAEEVKKVMGLAEAKKKEDVNAADAKAIADHPIDKKKDPEQEKQVEDKDVEEANEFTKAAAKAKLAGKEEFEFEGKTYPVEIDQEAAEKILGKSEEVEKKSKEVEESTKEYAKSLEKIANDRKMKSISKKDRDTLAKIADLLKRANEATGKDEDLKEYVGPALTPANQIAKKFGGKVKAINVKDEKGKKTKMFYAEDEEIEEAIDPRKFALGGDTKATKRDVDAILSKIFMSDKLAKQVEGSAAYKAGYKSKGKGKNPYKKDTADFHLFILGQQSAQAS